MPQNLSDYQYDSWSCVRTRTSVNGLAAMPTAGPWPQDAAIVVLHGGLEMESVAGVAVTSGAPPMIPSPNSLITNQNRVYLGGSQSGALPVMDIGGVKIYAITWAYQWNIPSPEGLDGDFALGVSPLDTDSPNVEYLPATNMNQNLISPRIDTTLNGLPETLPRVITQINGER